MIDQLVNFVIRPPRADYSPSHDLLESEFVLKGHKYGRKDLQVTNARGDVLQCSHYTPRPLPPDVSLPCVIYCHGNSGCRADANEAAIILLPSNITLFTLDFSGSGLSEGKYVSLGWNETEDLKAVVSHLRKDSQVSLIGLWGRSMGAVTSLLYGAQDPSIAGMVLDSPFSNLFDLMLELVDVYKIRLPKFTVKVAVQYMRRLIQKRAQFDIMNLDSIKVAKKSFIPVLIGHATDDVFIHPHHSDHIYNAYAGDKNIIKFDGDHNSTRPQFYYDSVTIFFYNVLRPPADPVAEAAPQPLYYDDGITFDEDIDESILYELMGMHSANEQQQRSVPVLDADVPDGSDSTEAAINQSRSRWQMSRTVVPCNIADQPDDIADLMKRAEKDVESASCSQMEGESTSGFGDSGRGDDSFQVSPSSSEGFASFPCTVDDEERMVMEAIAMSLQGMSTGSENRAAPSSQEQRNSSSQDESRIQDSAGGSSTLSQRWGGLFGRLKRKQ